MLHGFGFSGDDRFLVAAPLTHGTSCFVMPILAQGGRLVLIERARPAAILEAFARRDVSATFLPPTAIYGMLAEPEVSGTAYPKLRHLIYGEVVEATYGQAEAPQIITCLRAHEMIREESLASTGRSSLLTRVAIIDGDGAFLGPDEPGEIGAETEADAGELLGPVKAPKRIHFYAELPRSAVGKVLRREVKAAAEAGGEPATET